MIPAVPEARTSISYVYVPIVVNLCVSIPPEAKYSTPEIVNL